MTKPAKNKAATKRLAAKSPTKASTAKLSVTTDQDKRLAKNAALNAWRAAHRDEVNAKMRAWRKSRSTDRQKGRVAK